METKIEVLAMPHGNIKPGYFLFTKILTYENNNILVEMPSKNSLDSMSKNKYNEKNVAANEGDDSNSLGVSYTENSKR